MGRKYVIKPEAVVMIDSANATAKLQKRSQRRALVDHLIDSGGKSTMQQINDHFGYDCRDKVASLIRVGWLAIEKEAA
jgi:hypothetical protein